AIQATQAVIDQTRRVKQGLLQQLLTSGIGHTRFKQTEIGEIPDSWKFIIIDDIASFVGSGVTPRGGKKNYLDKGIPLVRSQNVHFGNLRLDNVAYISEEINAKMQRTKLHDGDVLLNITGASIGRCTFVPINFGQGNVNQHVCIIRCISKIASYHYVAIFLESLRGQSQIQELQAGLSREGLNFKQVRGIKIPLPPISEQNDISNLVMNVNESIIREERTLESLFNLKRGLMQDLLSGRVRVNGVK
ncbi:MAG: restriction endonuclease subunit S, partial [Deltaproteobacteria bacterium]|nr:restriction endonuclease subunit S [Deltaproteobacteria bacterium]